MIAVETRNLTKTYLLGDEEVHALREVDLRIEGGEYVAIMGPSGSGKSTMLNILGCLDRPTRGTYTLGGYDVSKMNDAQLSELRNSRIGFVFQSFNLIPQLTVLENIEVPLFYQGMLRRHRRLRSQELAELVGLHGRMRHRPRQLSGGQQQRVAIARALANQPLLLLADEPTGNLDSHTGKQIMDVLLETNRKQGQTVLMVTHDQSLAAMAHQVLHLRDGKMDKA